MCEKTSQPQRQAGPVTFIRKRDGGASTSRVAPSPPQLSLSSMIRGVRVSNSCTSRSQCTATSGKQNSSQSRCNLREVTKRVGSAFASTEHERAACVSVVSSKRRGCDRPLTQALPLTLLQVGVCSSRSSPYSQSRISRTVSFGRSPKHEHKIRP
jgi:hypothetical protein